MAIILLVRSLFKSPKVYDGPNSNARLLLIHCGNENPNPAIINSTSNQLYVKMRAGNSSLSRTAKGFLANYTMKCGAQILTNGTGELQSTIGTDILRMLNGANNCTWIIIADQPGERDQNEANQWKTLGKFCQPNAIQMHIMHASDVLKVVFQTDSIYNRTGFAATAIAMCGSPLQGPNGVIEVYNETQNDRFRFDLSSCEYNITVRAGRTIQVTFEMINMPASSNPNSCGDYYVMLKNGAGPESPLLGDGSYCGQDIPIIPKTTGNRLYIKYQGLRIRTHGFKLRYEEISTSCGGRYLFTTETENREISSPNYPRIPPLNTECEWVFMAPQGHRLRVDFIDQLDFATSPNPRRCEEAYVEFHDGSSALSPQLGRFCHDKSSSIWSTDNAIYIHYFTNVENPRTGFKVNVTIAKCGGTIVSDTGVINMPDLTDETALYCIWRLIASENSILSISFESLNLPLTANCSGDDYVKLTEATYVSNEASLGKYCGNIVPTEVIDVGSDRAIITLKTSRNMATRTFKLLYTSTVQKCGGNIDTPAGEITSWGYPNSRRRYCRWLITVPKGRRIRLEFIEFDLEATHPICTQWLRVYNGQSQLLPIGFYCGSNRPTVLESSSNKMLIEYLSWYNNGHRGFKVKYSSDDPSVCDGELNGDYGILQFPDSTLSSISCEWERTEQATSTDVTFAITVINATINANPDELCIKSPYSLLITSGQRMLGQFCGNYTTPQVVANPFGQTVIKANQIDGKQKVQFTLSYKVNTCGGVLEGPEEEITSPNFPQEYNASMDCAWSLQYPQGQSILIKFLTMDMELECDHDHVMVFNGPTSQSPIIGTYCGNSLPGDIQSQSNFLFITFHSDARHQRQGFKLTAEPVLSGCGGIFHRHSGEIASTNFPQTYPNNAECEWEIRVDVGYHIGLSFTQRFQLEMSDGCTKDFVEAQWNVNCGGLLTAQKGVIVSPSYPGNYGKSLLCNYTISAPNLVIEYEFVDFSLQQGYLDCRYDNVTMYRNTNRGRRRGSILQRSMTFSTMTLTYCGQEAPPAQWSQNSLSIVFQTDRWVEKRGFRMIYQISTCGEEITSPTLLKNPHPYLNSEDQRLNCTWMITAPANKNVLLRFESLELLSSYRCTGCGGFVNASLHGRHIIKSVTNQVTSQYEPLLDCHWTVEALPGFNIKLSIQDMNITDCVSASSIASCACDYLEVFDGKSQFAERIGRYCGSNPPATIISSGPSLWIRFVSDDIGSSSGFQGSITPCGLPILMVGDTTKMLTSPNYPANYPPDISCFWQIRGTRRKRIEIHLLDMDIEYAEGCANDRLTMIDNRFSDFYNEGFGQTFVYAGRQERTENDVLTNSPSLTNTHKPTFCGIGKQMEFYSLTNEVQIAFKSRGCGGRIFNTAGSVTSPLYPSNIRNNTECRWDITVPEQSIVKIKFLVFNIGPMSTCNTDYLKIFDVNAVTGTEQLKTRLCGETIPATIVSSGNAVALIYKTSVHNSGSGWTLNFGTGEAPLPNA
ncbi:hypothetical protein B566_EDAN014448 [Ephemera danica]|nr:hypothetical protein B566_EDAN014448 [Ephemera danica]